MLTGTVKWFNLKRGYGFIIPDEGGQDIFVHISALQKAGLTSLLENQRIKYVLAHSNGKIVAENLIPVVPANGNAPGAAEELVYA